jgi:hypothetical protein
MYRTYISNAALAGNAALAALLQGSCNGFISASSCSSDPHVLTANGYASSNPFWTQNPVPLRPLNLFLSEIPAVAREADPSTEDASPLQPSRKSKTRHRRGDKALMHVTIQDLVRNPALVPTGLLTRLERACDVLAAKALERIDRVRTSGATIKPETAARSVIRDWVRNMDPGDFSLCKTTVRVPSNKAQDAARQVLQESEDFLFAPHRFELMMRAERGLMTADFDLAAVRRRATKFKEAGVPPIFPARFEGDVEGQPFPTIDFIFAFTSGSYQKAVTAARQKNRIFQVPPASIRDIEHFRTCAFDDQKLNPLILKELIAYVRNNGRVQPGGLKEAIERYHAAYAFLETALAPMPASERTYKAYRTGTSLLFVWNTLWHMHYRPEDRATIAHDFAAGMRKPKGRKFTPDSIERMALLFPEIVKP